LKKTLIALFLTGAVSTACLFGQNTADSLYQRVLSKQEKNSLSIIMIDQAIAVEKQQAVSRPQRLADLLLLRGGLMQDQKRYDEAVLSYTASLECPADSAVNAAAHYRRGVVYDTLGTLRARKRMEERLLTSQMVWFGTGPQTGGGPSEFNRAEDDYRAVRSLEAQENLMQLLLATGKVPEAEAQMRILREWPSNGDREFAGRLFAYEILLCEARENFDEAERLYTSAAAVAGSRRPLDAFLARLRARRLEKLVRFEWTDRTDLETSVSAGSLKSSLEPAGQTILRLQAVTKRYLFEGADGGFLASGRAGAFGLLTDGRNGMGMNAEILETFLGRTWSAPGAGFTFDFARFEGDGRRVMKWKDAVLSETGESGFGFNLNAGVRHKLLATASYGQRSHWIRGLSARLSEADALFAGLGISASGGRMTDGVYGMGFAGSGWWPGRTHLVLSDLSLGADTRLTRMFTVGAAAIRRTAELTDHMEWTVPGAERTYAHRITLGERTGLLRLNGIIHLEGAGLRADLGGHHTFQGSGRIVRNDRSAQIVESLAGPGGIHGLLLNEVGRRIGGGGLDDARNLAGISPSVSRLYLSLQWANVFVLTQFDVNGLRARNRDVLFTLGVKPRRRTLSQCLHDLSFGR
jgi:tetratricopeptide (TPR) repeat protein